MNIDKLNQWLSLIANVGVLAGILIVAVELRQTQTELRAESSTMRTQMIRDTNNASASINVRRIREKIDRNEDLSQEEDNQARSFMSNVLRYLENLHYQSQIGVLDNEIWNGNRNTILNMCKGGNDLYSHLYPNGVTGLSYRASFRDLINPPCNEQ